MKPHSFSKTIADVHGVSAAIVLKYLAYKTRKSTNIRDNKQWYYDTLTELEKKFPYLGRSTIDDALRELGEKSLVEIGNFNKHAYDRTRWYHVPEQHWEAAEDHKISFHVSDAEAHGVTAAVIMFNLEYWLKKKLKAGSETHAISPEKLAEHLPLKASTIRTTLAKLVGVGALIKVPDKKSEYAFPPSRMRALRTKALLS